MSKLELVRGLYAYNEWANNQVLEAASQLTEDEFSRKQGASFESVEGNLAHIAGAQVIWLQRWTGGSNPKPGWNYRRCAGWRRFAKCSTGRMQSSANSPPL
ncbi:MAG TPA: DinB family protein [Dehalococcoidia bacterium]|nr:DinB family protein [Dehalococcoidia bacterium]